MVAKKFIEERKEETPDTSKASRMRSMDIGDKLIKEVLNGGYRVQPTPEGNSEIVETKRIQ
jgi:hypothetical protein